ncbi:MAG: DUF2997 domain-containing protein [Pirellulales bacterium]|nr:DUF2997 domain-containing protein [Pirellulales bacterium]
MKTIEIVIGSAGETTVRTQGFAGDACREASKFLEQALGGRIREDLTSEFYQAQSVPQNAYQGP